MTITRIKELCAQAKDWAGSYPPEQIAEERRRIDDTEKELIELLREKRARDKRDEEIRYQLRCVQRGLISRVSFLTDEGPRMAGDRGDSMFTITLAREQQELVKLANEVKEIHQSINAE